MATVVVFPPSATVEMPVEVKLQQPLPALSAELVDVCQCGCAKAERLSDLPLTVPTPAEARAARSRCWSCCLRLPRVPPSIKALSLYIVLGVALRMTMLAVLPGIPPLADLGLCAAYAAIFITTTLGRYYHKSVLRLQMVWMCLETLCHICPIVITIVTVSRALIKCGMVESGRGLWPLMFDMIQSYAVVGLLGETIKYIIIRRISCKPVAVSPYAVMVYAACVGATFGLAESLLYYFFAGVTGGPMRGFWSVPFHVGTAVAMGLSVTSGERWFKILSPWIILHGTFHIIPLVLHHHVGASVLSIAILSIVFVAVFYRLSALQKSFPDEVSVHALVVKGDVHPHTYNALAGLTAATALGVILTAFFINGFVAAY